MEKTTIFDVDKKQWEQFVIDHGFPLYRAAQIYQWCAKGVQDLSRMKNLPSELRTKISETYIAPVLQIENEFTSQVDATRKFVFRLHDDHVVETVLMRYKTGYSVCISSQAGCKMGCAFCASAQAGFGRSLTAGEMLAQVSVVADQVSERIHSVVVMGIGEPFDNFENLMRFLRLANDPEGLHLGARHITVSTCGLVPQMLEFMRADLQVNLSVSLHAPNDTLRKEMMPAAKLYDLDTLLAACDTYVKNTGRRITFEYSLFDQVNDQPRHAIELARRLRGIHCHINLIAANEFPGSPYHRSRPENVSAFMKTLEDHKMTVTLRREMGTDIMAACGQLRRGLRENETI